MVETEVARTMDELVQRGGDNSSEGLRAVGSTSLLALERFRRFIAVARRGISPESPALFGFLEALQLFASSFDSAGGFRLMKIARPPILFYGLYGSGGLDDADRRLVELVTYRGLMADGIDCLAGACCTGNKGCLVMLDKVLYDLDRAIDLYALGFTNFGPTERRAAAYAFVIEQVGLSADCQKPDAIDATLSKFLVAVANTLCPEIDISIDTGLRSAVGRSRTLAAAAIADLIRYGNATPDAVAIIALLQKGLQTLPAGAVGNTTLFDLASVYAPLGLADAVLRPLGRSVGTDAELDAYLAVVEQELCLQLEMERNWETLVHTMVANCSGIDESLKSLQSAVASAAQRVVGRSCASGASIDLPPTLETSFDTLVESVDRMGLGRPSRAFALQSRR
jgi:hypothetical protein